MNRKRWIALALLGSAAPVAAGTVGVIAFQSSAEGQARTVTAAQVALREHGHQPVVLDAAGSIERYRSQLDSLIDRRVDGIVLAMGKPVDSDAQLARAEQAGIRLVSIETGRSDHVIVELKSARELAGRYSAGLLFDAMGGAGKVAAVRFEKNAGAQASGQGLDVTLAAHPAIDLVASHTMTDTQNWQADVRSGIDGILDRHGTSLQGIWTAFDGQALIVDDAMRTRGWDRTRAVVVTIDGSQDIYRRIASDNSSLLATFAVPFKSMAKVAVERMSHLLQHPEEQARETIEFETTLVNASNVDEFIN